MGDLSYRYLAASRAVTRDRSANVSLSTAGGRAPHPYLFSGFVHDAGAMAQALLAVAEVARSRYFDPGAAARSRDPVVTANHNVLRFESFSGCNGVYARLDIDQSAMDGNFRDWGTTNVDVNQPLRNALARLRPEEPMRLSVGHDALTVETLDDTVIEKRVPLPDRWVRGFAEVSVIASGMALRHELPAGPARKAVRDLPRHGSRATVWIAWGGGGGRITANPGPDDTCLAGPYRIGVLARLVPFVRGLRIYAPAPSYRMDVGGRPSDVRAAQASAWEVLFGGARLVLMVSPEIYRGFSGEGAVLEALSAVDAGRLHQAAPMLRGQAAIDPADFGDSLGVDRAGAQGVINGLGATGRVGFDLARNAHFHRELPFDLSALDGMQPRLAAARDLVRAGQVDIDGDRAAVTSGTATYLVRFTPQGIRCTCPWFAKHRGERGPCKHALAVQVARAGESG